MDQKKLYKPSTSRYSTQIRAEYIKNLRNIVLNDVASKLARLPRDRDSEKAIDGIILSAIDTADTEEMQKADRQKLLKELKEEIYGYGPIQRLVEDKDLNEIIVRGPEHVEVEYKGEILDTDVHFDDEQHLRKVIDRIAAESNRHIDDANPMLDCKLRDGSRINAVIQPIAIDGSCLTIRKFSANPLKMENLLEYQSLNEPMAAFLEAAVGWGRLNVLVSGGTGSGKTTLLNVLSSCIPSHEEIITIEDAAELKLGQPRVRRMEARPANIEGRGEITIRGLVKNALRMRPDRIIVGEVRGGESLDMLQAMNTGHDGSLTTIHANSPRDALSRVETTTLMSGMQLPVAAIRQQCAGAFDLIVHTERLRDGSRKIMSITEVGQMVGELIQLQEVFRFVHDGETRDPDTGKKTVLGHFEATGVNPICCRKMQDNGAIVDQDWFRVGLR